MIELNANGSLLKRSVTAFDLSRLEKMLEHSAWIKNAELYFDSKDALQRFKDDKLEFSGQMSAVAAKSGASANAKYTDGVLIFTEEIGGLMLEASIGGQKFDYDAF